MSMKWQGHKKWQYQKIIINNFKINGNGENKNPKRWTTRIWQNFRFFFLSSLLTFCLKQTHNTGKREY